MSTNADDVLGLIEAQNQIADLLDGLKVGLEHRGWSPHLAAQAAIATLPPLIILQAQKAPE